MRYVAFLFAFGLILSSCTSDKITPTPSACPDIVSFSTQIQPMINANCATSGCHNVSGPGIPALTNYSEVEANAESILTVIRQENTPSPMPQGAPKLADSLIQQVACWISQGKLNN